MAYAFLNMVLSIYSFLATQTTLQACVDSFATGYTVVKKNNIDV